ncbi:MAG TPA: hypothetical protein VFZ21_32705 [Gemmatimonadaceae bacterium]|nr:hypothetical protein [Gemmatimonadaceae bacterium]
MRVTDRGTMLVIQDTPGCLWIFGTWFMAGGVVALAMPFVAVNRADVSFWVKLLVVGIGIVALGAGWYTIRTSPTTHTELDATSGRVRVRSRVPFSGTHIDDFAFGDIGVVQVLPSRDSDGDEQFSLRLLLRDGRAIALHTHPSGNRGTVEGVAARIREYLGLRTHT